MHVSRKVIEMDFDSETAISVKTQLVLSASQCHNSEQFSGELRCEGQQPSALFTGLQASCLFLLPEVKTTHKLRKLHSVETVMKNVTARCRALPRNLQKDITRQAMLYKVEARSFNHCYSEKQ